MPRVFHNKNKYIRRISGSGDNHNAPCLCVYFLFALYSSASRYVELMEVNINSADLGQVRCRPAKGL